ncbi:uncharacterized protein LOC124157397 [Ischnura elegans]|uniref:uncharacterized protein LOC124157397 n=1 Tax=Ischnura elegans TaxID=197161 RepID=UPI001ED8BADE|nr:uncharacterized protein LOC124157397 [Ischnura elegans]
MMPRKPRRSSILKPPKQVVRAPLQDLDSDEDGTLTQPTSRRVSFSRTSQIKEFDPSIGYMTNWHQSYEESLESMEGDENQGKSANVFEGLSCVQSQKVYKRKRTSTLQLSLNPNNDETNGGLPSDSNASMLQKSGARAVKQPRKSLDCFKTEFVEEGDTTIFFDELNLSEPLKSSYSHIESSSNITRTIMDSMLDTSDGDICRGKSELFPQSLSENVLKDGCQMKDPVIIHADENAAAKYETKNTLMDSMNMDCTLAPGKIEVVESYVVMEKLSNQQFSGSKEGNTSNYLPKRNDENKFVSVGGPSSFNETKSNILDLLPSSSVSKNDVYSADNDELLDQNNSLQISMELTNPLILSDMHLHGSNYGNNHAQIIKQAKEKREQAEDLEMTGTWGQILEQNNSALPSEAVNHRGIDDDKPKSLMDILNASKGSTEEKVVDNTVSSDMELSMTNGGIATQENLENGCVYSSQGIKNKENIVENSLSCSSLGNKTNLLGVGMDMTVPLKDKCSFSVEHSSAHREDLNATSPDAMGMDFTVPVGKLRREVHELSGNGELSSHSVDSINLQTSVMEDASVAATNENCEDSLINMMAESRVTESVNPHELDMEFTVPLGNLKGVEHVDHPEPAVESHMAEDTNPDGMGMELTVPLGGLKGGKYNPSDDNKHPGSELLDETIPDAMGMELTVPLGKVARENTSLPKSHDLTNDVLLPSQTVHDNKLEAKGMEFNVPIDGFTGEKDVNHPGHLSPERRDDDDVNLDMGMELTVPIGRLLGNKCKDSVPNVLPKIQLADDTNSEGIGMEFTVPLGRMKEVYAEECTDNLTEKSQVMSITNCDLTGMELTVPVKKLKPCKAKETVDKMLLPTSAVDTTSSVGLEDKTPSQRVDEVGDPQIVDETHDPEVIGMELTVPLGRMKEVYAEECTDNLTEKSQVMSITNCDLTGMELTVPVKKLKPCKAEETVDKMLLPTSAVDTTSSVGLEDKTPSQRVDEMGDPQIVEETHDPEVIGMELTVPLGRMKEVYAEECTDNLTEKSQVMSITNCELTGMELTVPVKKLKPFKAEETVDKMLLPTSAVDTTSSVGLEDKTPSQRVDEVGDPQIVDETHDPEVIGMELTVPLGRMKEVYAEECTDNLTEKSQIMSITNCDLTGMELTVPVKKLKPLKAEETIDNMLPAMDAVGGLQTVEEAYGKGVCKSKIMDDPSLDANGRDVLIPMLESRHDNVSPTENLILQIQQSNFTCPDDDGMEMTVPLGRLKKVKPEDCDVIEFNEPKVIDETHVEAEDVGSTSSLVTSVPPKCVYPSIDNIRGSKSDCESKINETNFDEPKIEDENSTSTGEKSQAMNNMSEMLERQPFHYAGDEEERKIVADNLSLPIPEDSIVVQTLKGTSEISVSASERGQKGGCGKGTVMMEESESIHVVETRSGEALHPSNREFGHCNEKTNQCIEGETIVYQTREKKNLEHEAMEQSLSEVTEGEPEATCRANTEYPVVETTFGRGELMDICSSPPKKSEPEDMDEGMEFTVALGKLKQQKEANKIMDAAPLCGNVSVNAKRGVGKSFTDSKCGDIIDPKPSTTTSEEPAPLPSEEIPMECAQVSEKDSPVEDGAGLELMDHLPDQDERELAAVKSNGEMSSVHPSEDGSEPMEGGVECQKTDDRADVRESSEKLVVKPCVNAATEISAVNPEESLKPVSSVEDWIKMETKKDSCEWAIWKLLENQYSFMFFHEALVLVVNLVPLYDGQDSRNARTVESVELKSCITDESAWYCRVIVKVILERYSPSHLLSKCSSSEQLPRLFEYLNEEFLAMNLLLKQMYNLSKTCPIAKKCDGFSFMVPSVKRSLLFEVKVSVLNWDLIDGVKPNHVKVKNVYGKMGLSEIQSILQTVRCDEHYLRNFHNEVMNFVFTLEQILE